MELFSIFIHSHDDSHAHTHPLSFPFLFQKKYFSIQLSSLFSISSLFTYACGCLTDWFTSCFLCLYLTQQQRRRRWIHADVRWNKNPFSCVRLFKIASHSRFLGWRTTVGGWLKWKRVQKKIEWEYNAIQNIIHWGLNHTSVSEWMSEFCNDFRHEGEWEWEWEICV